MVESLGSRRLAKYLRQHDLTPAAFAKLTKANRSQIYRLLTAQRGPSNGLAARIEDATGGRVKARDWLRHARPRQQQGQVPARDASAPHVVERCP